MSVKFEKVEGTFLVGNGSGSFRAVPGGTPWTEDSDKFARFDYDEALRVATDRHRFAQLNGLKGATEIFEEIALGEDLAHGFVMGFKA